MSEPQRRSVRVRRSPKIGTFLLIGAVLGVLVAVVAVNVTPADATISTPQAVGFLALLLAPLGAALGAVVALVVDRVSERGARIVEAERTAPAPVERPEEPVAERPVDQEDVDRS
ncbi:hypothetical protein [Amnibacterium kyonggiense]|uniref:Uncharacterized protein (TIGR04222 family) n=1 Tax=Amnibacterium kyonggiense TaxID=595671 RepID=A0A4R7FQJ4_9MICO|nr:hypothetical protein [Amnibacterium kyonggiense]TDS79948.1 uncharacterized protein (TIGR04222 family) [Amnibacterium kyonggiense]